MTPQSEALSLILNAISTNTGFAVTLDALPQSGGITAEITGAAPKGRYLDIAHGKSGITVLFLCKNTNQQIAYDTLCTIGNALDALTAIEGDTVYVSGAGVRSGAGLVGNDGGYFIYSLIAEISINT